MTGIIILLVMAIIFCVVVGETAIFVLLLIFSIILMITLLRRNVQLKHSITKVDPKKLHVLNLDKGGIFRLTGVGENYAEFNLKVLAKHLYRQGDYYWYELECDKGDGEKVWVEIEDDDETIVSIVLEKLELSSVDLTSAKLENIDENESGSVFFKSQKYIYTDSDSATFYRFSDDSKPEELYYWDFEKESYSINVEKWGKNEYQVFYCQKMKPSQVTVYLNKEKGV